MVFSVPHLALTAGGVASFAICLAIVLTKNLHGSHSLDTELGVQKVHAEPTPRIGGIAILISASIGCFFTPPEVAFLLWPMLIASLPAFLAGAAEDLFKRNSVKERLFATFASGVLAWWLTGVSLSSVGIPILDFALKNTLISVIFTAFALSGVANAINIIDGFNGLASGTVLLCLSALGLIAFQVSDAETAKICFVLAGAIFGFMLINYPKGKIFLGDGGAYLLGFLLGWVAVMVAVRNPYHVSPWAPLLACGYPILEVLFSMLRRRARTLKLGHPDRLHLHSLVWSRIARRYFSAFSTATQNAMVFPMLLLFAAVPATLAVCFKNSTPKLMLSFVFCAALYSVIYARLVHFQWTIPKLRPHKRSNRQQ